MMANNFHVDKALGNFGVNWRRPELWLPRPIEKSDPFKEAIKLYVSHEDIFGSKFSLKDLETELSSLSREDVIFTCSAIANVLATKPALEPKAQLELLESLGIGRELKDFLTPLARQGRPIFFEHQLVALSKAAMVWAEDSPARAYRELTEFGSILKCLFGITDLLHRDYDSPKLSSSVAYQTSFFFNTFDLNRQTRANLGNALGRTDLLWGESGTVIESGKNKGVDLNEEFRKASAGLSMDDFIAMSYALVSHYVQFQGEATDPAPHSYKLYLPDFFKNCEIPFELIEVFENLLALKDKKDLGNPKDELFFTDFLMFRKRPLIKMSDGKSIPITLNLLAWRLSEAIYWTLHNYYCELKDKKPLYSFSDVYGRGFQEYVKNLTFWAKPAMISGDPIIHYDRLYFEGKVEKRSSDLIMEYPSHYIFIEVTTYRPKALAMSRGDVRQIKSYIDERLIQKAKSLEKNIKSLRKGKLDSLGITDSKKRVVPVIILSSPFPLAPPVWWLINESLAKAKYAPENTESLIIMDIAEFELATAMMRSGYSLLDLMLGMVSNRQFSKLPFEVFLHQKLKRDRIKLENERVESAYNARFDQILKRLFPEEYWKRH